MKSSRTAAAMGLLLAVLVLLGISGCATSSAGAVWGVSVSDGYGPYGGPYGPYGPGGGTTISVGVYGRPY
jgi:hypothetical protein